MTSVLDFKNNSIGLKIKALRKSPRVEGQKMAIQFQKRINSFLSVGGGVAPGSEPAHILPSGPSRNTQLSG